MSHIKTYRIGEAAAIAKTTVRALQHYDSIGLLPPSFRSAGEYRLYTEGDLKRLHLIRLYRELKLPLAEIGRILEESCEDSEAASPVLLAHRERLASSVQETQGLIAKIDRIITLGNDMSIEERFEDFSHEDYVEEAEQRWGDTNAWKSSQGRMAKYSRADLAKARSEHEALVEEFASEMDSGSRPTAPKALELAERARMHIDHWYYPLSHAAHAQLAQLYTDDPRFKQSYDRVAPGLAEYVASAVKANADAHG